MEFYSETFSLNESTFNLLRIIINEKTGLYFDNSKKDMLADKLQGLVLEKGFSSFLDYYYYLKYDETSNEEWNRIIDALSVQETYFWREIDQIRALTDIIVPNHFNKYENKPFIIWSAACATGEEPISIAIALFEAGWFSKGLPIKIFATDASSKAIEKAKAGFYRERSFRNLPIELRSKYFIEKEGGYKVLNFLHNLIQFSIANMINQNDIAFYSKSNAIFCRNVFIYFTEETIKRTVKFFYNQMPSPGYLFVGVSESLLKLTNEFELKGIGNSFVYVKNNQEEK